jgi:hypothetical protein
VPALLPWAPPRTYLVPTVVKVKNLHVRRSGKIIYANWPFVARKLDTLIKYVDNSTRHPALSILSAS